MIFLVRFCICSSSSNRALDSEECHTGYAYSTTGRIKQQKTNKGHWEAHHFASNTVERRDAYLLSANSCNVQVPFKIRLDRYS